MSLILGAETLDAASHGRRPPLWLPQLAKWADYIAKLVVRGGTEPPAFRLSGASATSLHVAGRGLMGHLAAQTMAGCRVMWPDTCRRWLPVWPPLEVEDLISPRLSQHAFAKRVR